MSSGIRLRGVAASLFMATLSLAAFAESHSHRFPHADSPSPLVEWRGPDQRMAGVSMDQAIAMAERRYKARVVRAGISETNGRRVYVLRMLSEQGRVWTVRVDADSGAMM